MFNTQFPYMNLQSEKKQSFMGEGMKEKQEKKDGKSENQRWNKEREK